MPRLPIAYALMHLLVSAAHGLAHAELGIWPKLGEAVFIGLAVYALPAASMAARGHVAGGLLAAGLTASLLFGLHHHFLAVSPDHVAHLPPGPFRGLFRATAAASIPVDAAGLLAAMAALLRRPEWRG